MIRTQIYLPKPLYDDIKRQARAKGEPAAQVIRDALQREMIRPRQDIQIAKTKSWAQMAKDLNIKGGPKDLSRRIDDYLYGDE